MALSPLFFLVACVLRITGEGEVVFVQKRVGKGGSLFRLYKFVTMLRNSEQLGAGSLTVFEDPRVLPLGRFLRKTKINELPQLFNVINGSMSMIGPRPQTERCFNSYSAQVQKDIVKVRPGLSGIGSIVFRNEENMVSDPTEADYYYDHVIMPYKGLLEEWYVENRSLRLYLLLMVLTVWTMVRPNSRLVWRLLNKLPKPNIELTKLLGK